MFSVLLKLWVLEQISIIQGFILVFSSLVSPFTAVNLLRKRVSVMQLHFSDYLTAYILIIRTSL